MEKNYDIKISFYNAIKTISDSIDLMSKEINGHHKLVAYISLRIGRRLNLDIKSLRKLVFSALIHDIGILYFDKIIDEILRDHNYEEHAYVGYSLLKDYFPFEGYAEILKYHHDNWDNIEHNQNSYLSNILNLADLTAYFIDQADNKATILDGKLTGKIKEYSTNIIKEDIISGLESISDQRSFWLDTINLNIREQLLEDYIINNLDLKLNLEQIMDIGKIVSHIIDFRNPFTATHSKGIATISSKLAGDLSFSDQDVKIMEIAGYFHDIGKMILPLDLINKKGKLNKKEWAIMKSHTYYSYYVLENIKEIPKLKEWAAFHHEALNGTGYPFSIDKNKLSIGARILTVADKFTALTEDRPYRDGYAKDKVISILKDNVEENIIDANIVDLLIDNYEEYNMLRNEKQKEAKNDYNQFKKRTSNKIEDIYF